jgi:hypothetical protein
MIVQRFDVTIPFVPSATVSLCNLMLVVRGTLLKVLDIMVISNDQNLGDVCHTRN